MQHDKRTPKPLIIILALLQGVALTVLYRSNEYGFWPGTDPVWLTSLVTFSISFPLLTFLCVSQANWRRTLLFIVPFSALLALLGAYVGLQQKPVDLFNNWQVLATFIATGLIAAFKALMYCQQYISQNAITYARLFKLSWRNFLIFGLSWLFTLIFWGILHLGAGLFSALGIEFFSDLLEEDWFVIPALNLAFGFAIIVFRNIQATIDNIASLLKTTVKFLLPILTLVSLSFLATLLYTGLQPLWETGSGTLLLMWLLALTLFFINTVYQDEAHQRPYGIVLHRIILIGVACLPIYSLIAAYGLWLRVEQYGWSVDRCWAVLIWAILSCFTWGYLFGIVKHRDNWLEMLSRVNVTMGIVVLLAMLLVNSPLLNFQHIAAQSQLARLQSGELSFDQFDFYYFEHSLGRQGYLRIQQLKQELDANEYAKRQILEDLYQPYTGPDHENQSLDDFLTYVRVWPSESSIPSDLLKAIYTEYSEERWRSYRDSHFYLVEQDLNSDQVADYVLINESSHHISAELWLPGENGWYATSMNTENPKEINTLLEAFSAEDISVVEPQWQHLQIGEVLFQVRSE
ncbi:DUF4153 domain-containing protein [Alteromonas sp. ASW11-36]|uniref:DUF4153 domain-containing protein n=1 Tax=Alteromonas arenosi TaxID=3055817 RepID=A0ABT7SZT6_9ALTE|nr:DUF4153 domain-containing protein [Alteromonas sp. ASW11-36]MDM7861703.1 DUF4153 domain-containing protein [Alteromonas sp. ASW11-36]